MEGGEGAGGSGGSDIVTEDRRGAYRKEVEWVLTWRGEGWEEEKRWSRRLVI